MKFNETFEYAEDTDENKDLKTRDIFELNNSCLRRIQQMIQA